MKSLSSIWETAENVKWKKIWKPLNSVLRVILKILNTYIDNYIIQQEPM